MQRELTDCKLALMVKAQQFQRQRQAEQALEEQLVTEKGKLASKDSELQQLKRRLKKEEEKVFAIEEQLDRQVQREHSA